MSGMINKGTALAETIHSSGRHCYLMPGDKVNRWMFYDADDDTPRNCPLSHAQAERLHDNTSERGEFGMPTLGSTGAGFDVTHAAANMISEFKDYAMPTKHDGDEYPSAEAGRIMQRLLPQWKSEFLEKNRKYASVQTGHDLGPEGEVPDLNRKMGILVDRLWYGNPTVGEETTEVVRDMIGHLFLLLDKLEHGDE